MNNSINVLRILSRVEQLAHCSEQADGMTRVYLSSEHRMANERVLEWMNEAGMTCHVDAVGNVVGRYEGLSPGLPSLVLGSHLDTVRDGGRYDGILGVLAAIECVDVLNAQSQRLGFAITVIGFADEEGVRFQSTYLGSRAVAGVFDAEFLQLKDAQGMGLGEAMREFGLNPEKIHEAAMDRQAVLAYMELHIEQGPVLERELLPVGVVTGINGAARYAVTFKGEAGHAGTVPMVGRRDALAAAAEAIVWIENLALNTPDLTATVGAIRALPGALNVIAGQVEFSMDVRSAHDAIREKAQKAIEQELNNLCDRRHLSCHITLLQSTKATACAGWLQAQVASAISVEGHKVRYLPSGAGHDAVMMNQLTDVGIIFIPCLRGISHNPSESVTSHDVQVGCEVLLRFISQFKALGENHD